MGAITITASIIFACIVLFIFIMAYLQNKKKREKVEAEISSVLKSQNPKGDLSNIDPDTMSKMVKEVRSAVPDEYATEIKPISSGTQEELLRNAEDVVKAKASKTEGINAAGGLFRSAKDPLFVLGFLGIIASIAGIFILAIFFIDYIYYAYICGAVIMACLALVVSPKGAGTGIYTAILVVCLSGVVIFGYFGIREIMIDAQLNNYDPNTGENTRLS